MWKKIQFTSHHLLAETCKGEIWYLSFDKLYHSTQPSPKIAER
jgi:hypothetical protein